MTWSPLLGALADGPGCNASSLCPWPCNSLSNISTWVFCVFLCVIFFLRKHILDFSRVYVAEGVGGSGKCTNGDPAGLGSGRRPWMRHFTCWALTFSSGKWRDLNWTISEVSTSPIIPWFFFFKSNFIIFSVLCFNLFFITLILITSIIYCLLYARHSAR